MNQSLTTGKLIPKLAMINDFTGYGRCSTAVSLPVISTMRVQVCPVPTSILSNHLGFPSCYFEDYTVGMRQYLNAWEQLQLTFDGLYCGFLGSAGQISIVKDLLQSPMFQSKDSKAIFLLDPVLGDHGKAYSTITATHCEKMRDLIQAADILTPNITEACLLTETPYKEQGWVDYELEHICRKLEKSSDSPKRIVITGLHDQTTFVNYIWENGVRKIYQTPSVGVSRPGTGDLFASILAADALNGVSFFDSVKKAADFICLCIRGSEEAHIPVQEGVIFENYLRELA